MDYDYNEAIKEDLVYFITERSDEWKDKVAEGYDYDDIREYLYDEAFCSDSITGNASGSYTFNAYKAEEYLAHNWDLLADALDEFGGDTDVLRQGPESCDVTIRCYLLGQVLDEAMEECGIQDYIDEYEEENGDDDEE